MSESDLPFQCCLFLHVEFHSCHGENLKIVGNLPELGNWNPYEGLQLKTDSFYYPKWFAPPLNVSKSNIILKLDFEIEFKIVMFFHDKLIAWEILPEGINRKVSAKFFKFELFIEPNKMKMRQKVLKKFPSIHEYEENSSGIDENSDEETYYKRYIPKKKDLLKLAKADSDSEDDNMWESSVSLRSNIDVNNSDSIIDDRKISSSKPVFLENNKKQKESFFEKFSNIFKAISTEKNDWIQCRPKTPLCQIQNKLSPKFAKPILLSIEKSGKQSKWKDAILKGYSDYCVEFIEFNIKNGNQLNSSFNREWLQADNLILIFIHDIEFIEVSVILKMKLYLSKFGVRHKIAYFFENNVSEDLECKINILLLLDVFVFPNFKSFTRFKNHLESQCLGEFKGTSLFSSGFEKKYLIGDIFHDNCSSSSPTEQRNILWLSDIGIPERITNILHSHNFEIFQNCPLEKSEWEIIIQFNNFDYPEANNSYLITNNSELLNTNYSFFCSEFDYDRLEDIISKIKNDFTPFKRTEPFLLRVINCQFYLLKYNETKVLLHNKKLVLDYCAEYIEVQTIAKYHQLSLFPKILVLDTEFAFSLGSIEILVLKQYASKAEQHVFIYCSSNEIKDSFFHENGKIYEEFEEKVLNLTRPLTEGQKGIKMFLEDGILYSENGEIFSNAGDQLECSSLVKFILRKYKNIMEGSEIIDLGPIIKLKTKSSPLSVNMLKEAKRELENTINNSKYQIQILIEDELLIVKNIGIGLAETVASSFYSFILEFGNPSFILAIIGSNFSKTILQTISCISPTLCLPENSIFLTTTSLSVCPEYDFFDGVEEARILLNLISR